MIESLESYTNLGPIVDFVVVDLDRQGQVACVGCACELCSASGLGCAGPDVRFCNQISSLEPRLEHVCRRHNLFTRFATGVRQKTELGPTELCAGCSWSLPNSQMSRSGYN